MKHSDRSILITQVLVRACYVLLAALAVALPVAVYSDFHNAFLEFNLIRTLGKNVLLPFFLVLPAGYAALICIDKLLRNVRNNRVFFKKNVTLLRVISYCCFYAAAVGFAFYFIIAKIQMPFESLLILAVGEGFVGLIVRVVKNIFERAIEIKEENDLVI